MLKIFDLSDKSLWNEVVYSFKKHDIYYFADHAELYKQHGDGEPLLVYYADELIRAINVVMKRDIADSTYFPELDKNKYFDLTTAYGYGGFLVEGEINKQSLFNLKQEYLNFCNNESIISEFVRFHPLLNNYEYNKSIFDIENVGPTITINLESPKDIWSSYESSNRRNIKKSIKNDIKIFWGTDPRLFDEFLPMYKKTMDRDNANKYYYFNKEYYELMKNNLENNYLIFYAMKENKIIAMSIIFLSNNNLHYHLSASDEEYSYLNPTNLLLHKVSLWGSENGFKKFHLGGGLGGKENSLYRFKRKFNKNSNTEFNIGKKIYNKNVYNELIDMRTNFEYSTEDKFFPQYRSQN